jgi:hypothetical protein
MLTVGIDPHARRITISFRDENVDVKRLICARRSARPPRASTSMSTSFAVSSTSTFTTCLQVLAAEKPPRFRFSEQYAESQKPGGFSTFIQKSDKSQFGPVTYAKTGRRFCLGVQFGIGSNAQRVGDQ